MAKEKNGNSIKIAVLLWRRRRDSNPRTAYHGYTISSRAPSTKLGDSSMRLFIYALLGQRIALHSVIIQYTAANCKRELTSIVFFRYTQS